MYALSISVELVVTHQQALPVTQGMLSMYRQAGRAPSPIGHHQHSVQDVQVKTISTKPIEGQKTGTSGLRKKTNVFMGEHYLANW